MGGASSNPRSKFLRNKSAFDSAWAEREVEIRQARNRVPQVEQSTNREVEKLDGTFFNSSDGKTLWSSVFIHLETFL